MVDMAATVNHLGSLACTSLDVFRVDGRWEIEKHEEGMMGEPPAAGYARKLANLSRNVGVREIDEETNIILPVSCDAQWLCRT